MAQRVGVTVFKNNQTKGDVLIVNVHAQFSKDVIGDIKLIQDKAAEEGITQICNIGDYNRNLCGETESDKYSKKDISNICNTKDKINDLTICAAKASFMYDKDAMRQVVETRDGVITTFKGDLTVCVDLNKQSSYSESKINKSFIMGKAVRTEIEGEDEQSNSVLYHQQRITF